MCRPAVPAGWGPANSSTTMRSDAGAATREPGALQTYVLPSQSRATATSPASKSASRSASTTSTAGACGRVSIAVTKIACGMDEGAGTRENGRVRNAVHMPDSTSSARTASASGPPGGAAR